MPWYRIKRSIERSVFESGTGEHEGFRRSNCLSPMFSFCLHESATLPGVNGMSHGDLSTPHFEADDTDSATGAGEAVHSPWKSVLDLNADPRWQLAQRIVASRSFANGPAWFVRWRSTSSKLRDFIAGRLRSR